MRERNISAITTNSISIHLDHGALLRITLLEGAEIDIEETIKNCSAILKVAAGKKRLILVNANADWAITTEARAYFVRENILERTIAMAFVADKLPKRLIVNFFIRLHKTSIPIKLFSKEEKALIWLKSFKIKY